MEKIPEIIERVMEARAAAGLKVTFHYPANGHNPPYDATGFAKDAAQLEQWKATAARRGVPVTIG